MFRRRLLFQVPGGVEKSCETGDEVTGLSIFFSGAPGTVPLRGLVRKYASVNPDLDPNHNTKFVGPLLPHQGDSKTWSTCARDL